MELVDNFFVYFKKHVEVTEIRNICEAMGKEKTRMALFSSKYPHCLENPSDSYTYVIIFSEQKIKRDILLLHTKTTRPVFFTEIKYPIKDYRYRYHLPMYEMVCDFYYKLSTSDIQELRKYAIEYHWRIRNKKIDE